MTATAKPRILCVDDEPDLLDGLARNLRSRFDIVTAVGGEAGIEAIGQKGPFAAVVSDLRMPVVDGVKVLAAARRSAPDASRILLTGYAELDAAISAVNFGEVYRFLTKPITPATLALALEQAVEHHELRRAQRELLEQTLRGSVQALLDVLSLANPAAFSRAVRISGIVDLLLAGFDVEERWVVEVAGSLAQVGAVTLPDAVAEKLRNGGVMSDDEQELVDRLPELSARIIESIPRMGPVVEAIRAQREPFDPALPLAARILRVAADLDELEAQGVPSREAYALLRSRTGCYDPEVLAVLDGQPTTGGGSGAVIEVGVGDLTVGLVIARDVMDDTGRLLVGRGQHVSEALLDRIRNYATTVGIDEPLLVMMT
jgi:response regulator RpfG family c-di-GMP phosphodiesterase